MNDMDRLNNPAGENPAGHIFTPGRCDLGYCLACGSAEDQHENTDRNAHLGATEGA